MTDPTTDPTDPTEDADPPMEELPLPSRAMVERFVRTQESHPNEAAIQSRIAEVLMADALGRAIHKAKRTGGPWPAPCVRQRKDGTLEEVVYGYEDGTFNCLCEAMAFHLISLMKGEQIIGAITRGGLVGLDGAPLNGD